MSEIGTVEGLFPPRETRVASHAILLRGPRPPVLKKASCSVRTIVGGKGTPLRDKVVGR